MRLLDLFCGRWGWSRAFAARGWECVGVDLQEPPEIPHGCEFVLANVLDLEVEHGRISNAAYVPHTAGWESWKPDFIVASSPCDEFSCFQMRHFQPAPPYPQNGIKLFNHTRQLCEGSGVLYVMENVRAAQEFVGRAKAHSGSFYLWGNAVPVITPTVHKAVWGPNSMHGRSAPGNFAKELLLAKAERKAKLATIPPLLANCVADYAERLLEGRAA